MQAQQEAYLLWLRDRGLAHVPMRPRPAEAQEVPPSPEEVENAAQPEKPTESETATSAPVPLPASEAPSELEAFWAEASTCEACPLAKGRTQVSRGFGGANPRVLWITDGPFAPEDAAGEVLSGPSRELLERMAQAMNLGASDIYVTGGLLCRLPDDNRPPADAWKTCRHHLSSLVDILSPEVVIPLGAVATAGVLGGNIHFAGARGQWHSWEEDDRGPPVLPTYHPRDLLRYPPNKRLAWHDLQRVMERLGLRPQTR